MTRSAKNVMKKINNESDKKEANSVILSKTKRSHHKKWTTTPLRTVPKPYRFGIPGGPIFERCGNDTKVVELNHVKLTTIAYETASKQVADVDTFAAKTPPSNDKRNDIDTEVLKCEESLHGSRSDIHVAKMPAKESNVQVVHPEQPAGNPKNISETPGCIDNSQDVKPAYQTKAKKTKKGVSSTSKTPSKIKNPI